MLSDHTKPAIDDPAWVLEKYREAKELIDALYHDDVVMCAVNREMRDDIEAFWASTFMDVCTTFGADCACNHEPQEGSWASTTTAKASTSRSAG